MKLDEREVAVLIQFILSDDARVYRTA